MLLAPGVRDRVVDITLLPEEGGLNLDMSQEVIDSLDWRGRAAGILIAARFDPDVTKDPKTGQSNESMFANHRWVRYRNFMAAFEDLSRRFAQSSRDSNDAAQRRGEPSLDVLIEKGIVKRENLASPRGWGNDAGDYGYIAGQTWNSDKENVLLAEIRELREEVRTLSGRRARMKRA